MDLGKVDSIFRYPVKSMMGEKIEETCVTSNGVLGDRVWAVRDEVRGGIRGAKKIPQLMQLSAACIVEPTEYGSDPAAVTLADGEVIRTDDQNINARLSQALDHKVTIWPIMPKEQLDHYRRGAPDSDDLETELRQVFGRTADEPLPDLSIFPPEILEYESPPGTYFDAFPLLILSKKSLAAMNQRQPASIFDRKRFRPNLLIEDFNSVGDFPEEAWEGFRLKVGSAVLKAEVVCPRCVVTTHGFEELPKDPSIMRSLVKENNGNLGLYASVEEPGKISAGDKISRIE
ncbi:MAG: Fe-S oxidoreductase [Gammaproteobacteria bacterium]|nr:Fe-S oxidoreductase [Gammaproteobacteria bacterium]